MAITEKGAARNGDGDSVGCCRSEEEEKDVMSLIGKEGQSSYDGVMMIGFLHSIGFSSIRNGTTTVAAARDERKTKLMVVVTRRKDEGSDGDDREKEEKKM